ncbi:MULTISPECIES: helix-turn-helix domain-containing protein [unclassified Haladaptatus]|uniref:helix-turn-helix domain-containing protein n=1 Tax=unclassified Haladaptatus TaxID=2622732 RepID=UPI00209BCB85|nr:MULTISPECIES: helix-turn-helix domain-containing protein [unclassified Haladaptatus]MCO8243245.1 helix-turn-helix domain-containing protein [Haladaptatus sp. AB643]MCO8252957.1 helix-turn-helix domain-containing protein [Haladaptatus sp. AB618]
MAVVAELTLKPFDFPLGKLLTAGTRTHIEFERIVPVGPRVVPVFWAWGDDLPDFEERVRAGSYVNDLTELDRVDDRVLYLMDWEIPDEAFLEGLQETNGIIRSAEGYDGEDWSFELLFPSYDDLSEFHNYSLENDVEYTLGRIYTLREAGKNQLSLSLTESQREALLLALQRGYFSTPSRVTLDELAAELDISQQALSERIRRGNESLLEQTLLDSGNDDKRD